MMLDVKTELKNALQNALPAGLETIPDIAVQDTPDDKPGDYGTPLAFQLAKISKQNPAQIAKDLAAKIVLPELVARAEAVGPYLNFFLKASAFTEFVAQWRYENSVQNRKVIVEHTSVNPNKEWHVGHIRGALIGDAMARMYGAAGYEVEVQNYIDDTGRQAGESLFARDHYGTTWDGKQKLDHWLGELYVRLHQEMQDPETKTKFEPEILQVIHKLERGELREDVEAIVRAHIQTAQSLGIDYDLLVWESDIVRGGFVDKALGMLLKSPHLVRPNEGKYAGAVCIDLSPFVPGLEEPLSVLLRSNGTSVYACKDIAFHYWKFGLFEGLSYAFFEKQNSGKALWTSAPNGESKNFAHAQEVLNVIDTRQALPQMIVKAGLAITESGEVAAQNLHHLANETVLLEGKTMSGRKGITISADQVIAESKQRALEVVQEKNAGLKNPEAIAEMVGLGALKFAFLKTEPKTQIDFRWEQALALSGDTAPVVQYAHARARRIAREYAAQNLSGTPDFVEVGQLELHLAKVVRKYPDVLATCLRIHSPHPMCAYVLELAAAFNSYYNHKGADGKPDTSVLNAAPGLREARLAIVVRVADAIREALAVLGIDAPDEM